MFVGGPGTDALPSYEANETLSNSQRVFKQDFGSQHPVVLLFVVCVPQGVAYRSEPRLESVLTSVNGPCGGDVVVARGDI